MVSVICRTQTKKKPYRSFQDKDPFCHSEHTIQVPSSTWIWIVNININVTNKVAFMILERIWSFFLINPLSYVVDKKKIKDTGKSLCWFSVKQQAHTCERWTGEIVILFTHSRLVLIHFQPTVSITPQYRQTEKTVQAEQKTFENLTGIMRGKYNWNSAPPTPR